MMRIDLTDFSGGIFETISPADFSKRQHAKMYGFVLEDEVRLRSQGPIQNVGSLTDVAAVTSFRGLTQSYIVIIKTDGSVWWAVAPAGSAANTTTAALSFTQFAGVSNTDFRFTSKMRWKVADEYRQALLVHSLSGTADALIIYEDAGVLTHTTVSNFYPTLTQRVAEVMVVDGGAGYTSVPTVTFDAPTSGVTAQGTATIKAGAVTAITVTEPGSGYTSAPAVTISGGGATTDATAVSVVEDTAETGAMPRHNVASMWKDTLVLGDIEWSAANAASGLNAGNVQRYSNFIWHALDGTDLTLFDPRYPERVAEEGSVIVGLQEVSEGLLVLTTSTTGVAGLILLRGTPSSYTVETLRPGLGLLPGVDTTQRTALHTWWNELGSTVFIDSLGKVQQVRGVRVARIDRHGPEAPEQASATDEVAAVGSWLFASRGGRLLVLRSFGTDGAWTELVAPGTVTSLTPLEDTLYFVSDGVLYRYCLDGPSDERGMIDGVAQPLVFGSQTLGDSDETADKWWTGLTVRAQGVSGSPVLNTVVLYAGGVLQSPTPGTASFTLNQPIGARELVSVPGLGPSVECSAELTFTGDVRLELVRFFMEAGDDER